MMRLIGAELYKILRKKTTLAGLLLVAVLNIVMFQGWIGLGTNFVMKQDGTYAEGAEAIALDQEIAARYEGELTDGKIERIIEDFRLPRDFNGTDYPVGYISRNNMYGSISSFHDENGDYNGNTLTDVYGEMGKHLRASYNRSWVCALYYLTYLFLLGIGYLLIVSVTPIFSDEYGSGMDALILTARYGKNRCAWAKVLAVFAYSLLVSAVCLLVNTLLFLLLYGTAGWNGSLQFNEMSIFMNVPYEISFARAGVYAICLWIGAGLFLSGISLLVSAYSRSSYAALIVCALLYTVPLFFNGQEPVQYLLLSLFPIQQMQLMTPFAVEPPNGVPFQLIVLFYSLAAALICGIFAGRGFARHQVKN